MFPRLGEAISAIDDLRARGLIRDSAIGGAFAAALWAEVRPTFDVDFLVLLPAASGIVDMAPIYEWARERGYGISDDHITISGVPVQFLVLPSPLADEAVAAAVTRRVAGVPVKIVTAEYLSALWLLPSANSQVRRERIAQMRESGVIDEARLAEIMRRYSLFW